jgi:hypothetical protein
MVMNNRRSAKRPRSIQLDFPNMLDATSVASCTPDMIGKVAASNANDNLAPLVQRAVKELTEQEAAADLRISVDLLQRERAAGNIRYARAGRRIFYPVICIEEYRQERIRRTCPPTSSVEKANIGTSSDRMAEGRSIIRRARLKKHEPS